MKKICYMIVLLLSVQFIIAQAPMAFNYQGVARNAQGQALSNQTIKVRASLVKNIDGGISIVTFYTETRTVTTNQLGLFSFKIGDDPAALTGSITNGQWNDGNTTQHLKIELDVNNSGTWTDMGTQQIVSVPYALYAGEAAKAKELTQASVAFGASSKMPQTFLANETDWVAFDALESNSTGFNLSTDAFTAQASGMHQFTGIIWATPINTVTSNSYVYVYLYVNGVAKTKFRYLARANESSITCPFSTNLYLNKNDVVKVYFQNSTAVPIDAGSSTSLPHTFFSGHLIR